MTEDGRSELFVHTQKNSQENTTHAHSSKCEGEKNILTRTPHMQIAANVRGKNPPLKKTPHKCAKTPSQELTTHLLLFACVVFS
jgi:hypothetical protein